MRANVQADQLNWLELLDGACMAASSAPLSMTPPRSPFEIETSFAMRVPIDSQPLMDQTFQNRGEGQLVRETMVYENHPMVRQDRLGTNARTTYTKHGGDARSHECRRSTRSMG
jgi:hypothetical protein